MKKSGFAINSLPVALIILILALSFSFSCESYRDSQLEYAQFLLDAGKFDDAVVVLTRLHNKYPNDIEVTRHLASALMAYAALGDDRSYLALVADYFEEKEESKSDFQHFADRSPAMSEDGIEMLKRAKTLLDESIPLNAKRSGDWLQLGFIRLLEINAVGIIKTGALSEDNYCNSDPSKGPDGVPDDYDSGALSAEDTQSFEDNADKVGGDFERAGLSKDISIVKSVERIASDLASFGSVTAYLDDQFGAGAPCPL